MAARYFLTVKDILPCIRACARIPRPRQSTIGMKCSYISYVVLTAASLCHMYSVNSINHHCKSAIKKLQKYVEACETFLLLPNVKGVHVLWWDIFFFQLCSIPLL
jgi:hypothetical protein